MTALRPIEVVRAALRAYEDKNRDAMSALLAADYRFTSPLDNGLDRDSYLEICWPNSKHLRGFREIHAAENGDIALIVYEVTFRAEKRMRNCEAHTVRDGKLVATEVYFGWDVPHPVAPGKHRDP